MDLGSSSAEESERLAQPPGAAPEAAMGLAGHPWLRAARMGRNHFVFLFLHPVKPSPIHLRAMDVK